MSSIKYTMTGLHLILTTFVQLARVRYYHPPSLMAC